MLKLGDTGFDRWRVLLRPEVIFALVALTSGLCMVFLTAPFEAPDEATHFWRAYQVSEGRMISVRNGDFTGGWLPQAIVNAYLPFENLVAHPENHTSVHLILQQLEEPFDDQNRMFTPMGFAALNSPMVYLPQAIGIAIGRFSGFSALGMMYSGRIMNLLVWLCLFTLAIRTTPVFKWVFVLLGLLPMNVFLAASLSADAIVDAISNLLFALVLWAIWQKDCLTWRPKLAIAMLCVLMVFTKLPYVTLTGLILLIPASRFNSTGNKIRFISVTLGIVIVLFFGWSHIVNEIYPPNLAGYIPAHKAWLKSHPFGFPILAVRSFFGYIKTLGSSFIGNLGFLDTPLPIWIYISFPLMLIGASILDDTQHLKVSFRARGWILLLCFCVLLLIEFSQYLVWTPPDSSLIQGVQGRYFLPIAAPAFLALFFNKRFELSTKPWYPIVIVLFLLIVSFVSCWTLYERYFPPV